MGGISSPASHRPGPRLALPRRPETTALHAVVRENVRTFLARAEERGGVPRFVERELLRSLARPTAPSARHAAPRVRITHPFHPRTGQDFELVVTRSSGGEVRACLEDAEGRLVWLPRRWTSLEAPTPFVEAAAGRAVFQTEELLELGAMIQRLRALVRPTGGPSDV